MRPKKALIDFVKNKYPKLELFYDVEDGVIWSIHNNGAIRFCGDKKEWYSSCLTPFWCTSYCKKLS